MNLGSPERETLYLIGNKSLKLKVTLHSHVF